MKTSIGIVIKIYGRLVRIYPSSFREEFGEEMLIDFSDMAKEASEKGRHSLVVLCLRELVDFLVSLWRIHLQEGQISKVIRSQTVNHGLRSALGFGIAFAGLTVATWSIRDWLFTNVAMQAHRLPAWYYEMFPRYNADLLLFNILDLITSASAGLILGILLALVLGKRSQLFSYVLAGTLGWLLPGAVFKILFCQPFNLGISLNAQEGHYLGMTIPVLQGGFLAGMFNLVANEKMVILRRFIPGLIIYPAVAYAYIRTLIHFDLAKSPVAFVALMSLLALFLGSVIIAVMIGIRKIPWVVIAGAVGYPVLSHAAISMARLIHLPMPEPGIGISEASPFMLQVSGVTQQVIFGMMFGLILGVILGLQRKNTPSPILA